MMGLTMATVAQTRRHGTVVMMMVRDVVDRYVATLITDFHVATFVCDLGDIDRLRRCRVRDRHANPGTVRFRRQTAS